MLPRLVFIGVLPLVLGTAAFAQNGNDVPGVVGQILQQGLRAAAQGGGTVTLTARSPLQGATVADLSPILAIALGLNPQRKGVVITNVASGSAAQAVGFKPGDIILSLNQKIADVSELQDVANKGGSTWRVGIERRGQQISAEFEDDNKTTRQLPIRRNSGEAAAIPSPTPASKAGAKRCAMANRVPNVFVGECDQPSQEETDFIAKRNAHALWNTGAKRDILGFRPGMTIAEMRAAFIAGAQKYDPMRKMFPDGFPNQKRNYYCFGSDFSIDCDDFVFDLTRYMKPQVLEEVLYTFQWANETLDVVAKNVAMQFDLSEPSKCDINRLANNDPILRTTLSIGCDQWPLEDNASLILFGRGSFTLTITPPDWIASFERQAYQQQQRAIPPPKF